jgi:hypothetical protein
LQDWIVIVGGIGIYHVRECPGPRRWTIHGSPELLVN